MIANEQIDYLRKTYDIPDEYIPYSIHRSVWEYIFPKYGKDMKIEAAAGVLSNNDEVDIFVDMDSLYYGAIKQEDFIMCRIKFQSLHMNDYSIALYVFTKNFKKFKDKYLPKAEPLQSLQPGIWSIEDTHFGKQLVKCNTIVEDMPVLTNDAGKIIDNEISKFVEKESFYTDNNIIYKRGILMYGPPGNGKTSLIKNLVKQYDKACAILIDCTTEAASQIGFIQKVLEDKINDNILKILIFEDIDGVSTFDRSKMLNLFDGIIRLHNVVFFATTNYPDRVDDALKNRPSRFDRLIMIDVPDETVRETLLKRYFKDITSDVLKEAAKKSKGFSGAMFKELYIYSRLHDATVLEAITEMNTRMTLCNGGADYIS